MISEWFQPSAADYQRPAMLHLAGRLWWAAALPVAGGLLLAFYDIRFLLTAFLLVLVVIPAGVFNVYFFGLLSPDLQRRLRYQQVEVTPGEKVEIRYASPPHAPLPSSESFLWDAVESVRRCGGIWVVRFRKSLNLKPGFIAVPQDAVEGDITYPAYYD